MFSLFLPVTKTQTTTPDRTIECAVTISALRVIASNNLGKAIYADNLTANPVLGLSLAAGIAGDRIAYLPEGIYTDAGWNWTPDLPLFLIANGQMSHTPPTSGWIVQVGYSRSVTTIVFTPDYEAYLIES